MPAPGQKRFTRLKTLGADYTEEAIREQIAGRRVKAVKALREQCGVSLLIDIENSIKAAQSKIRQSNSKPILWFWVTLANLMGNPLPMPSVPAYFPNMQIGSY